jgi:hypothetical protein
MSTNDAGTCYHSNRYDASACEHCKGVIGHEPWCIRMNGFVYYAYEVVLDADKMTTDDALRLHSLGVTWTKRICSGSGNTSDINRSLF